MTISGTLFIIAAPSGGGKTSLVNKLIEQMDNLEVSVSYTTRQRRPAEEAGVHYHFVNENEFKDMIDNEAFLEHAKVFDHYYGTSRAWVEKKLQKGTDVILEIDWQGAEQIKQIMPACKMIYILPLSLEILEKRLKDRGQDHAVVIASRMEKAKAEIAHAHEFDYLVVNDDFDSAVFDLQSIVQAMRLGASRQLRVYRDLLANLS